MTTKEFFDLIDMEKFNEDGMQMIIPIQEKFPIDESKTRFDFTLNKDKKVIFKKWYSIPEDYDCFIEQFFKVCRKSNKKNDECYDVIDLRELSDETCYVHDGRKNVWLIINF